MVEQAAIGLGCGRECVSRGRLRLVLAHADETAGGIVPEEVRAIQLAARYIATERTCQRGTRGLGVFTLHEGGNLGVGAQGKNCLAVG